MDPLSIGIDLYWSLLIGIDRPPNLHLYVDQLIHIDPIGVIDPIDPIDLPSPVFRLLLNLIIEEQ